MLDKSQTIEARRVRLKVPRFIGMTLIEVLVAMIILGTLLSSALLARARYVAQAARASEKLKAVAAADALLTEWSVDWSLQAEDSSGRVPDEPRLSWKRQIVDRPDAQELGARVLRLEIAETPGSQTARPIVIPSPLASVEVVIPLSLTTNKSGRSTTQPSVPLTNGSNVQP